MEEENSNSSEVVRPLEKPLDLDDAYVILSLKHSPCDGMALWWGPNDSGYVIDLYKAGVYSGEKVRSNPAYYNNGESTRAVRYHKAFCSANSKLVIGFQDAKTLICIAENKVEKSV